MILFSRFFLSLQYELKICVNLYLPNIIVHMSNRIKNLLTSRHLRSNLLLIITAVLLLEMVSGVQYFLAHDRLEDELEKQAEMELMLKAVIASSTRTTVESALLSHLRDITKDLAYPDSMFSSTEWLVKYSKMFAGGGIAFVPDYYPQKGRLFEPYSYWKDGEIITTDIASSGHDYTESNTFRWVLESESSYWSGRYYDTLATNKNLITYCLPIHDKEEEPVAVLYMDIDTERLGDTLNARRLFPSSFVMVLDKMGKQVAGPSKDFVSQATTDYVISLINDSSVVKRKSEKRQCWIIEFKNPENGKDGEIFISEMDNDHKWQVAVVCYDEEVFGELIKMRLTILLLMIGAFLVLMGIINRVARNEKHIQKTEMEKKRIDGELRVANKIQQNMLPVQCLIEDDVEVDGSLVPAREVGGDLFDYYLRDEKLIFCIGDVSGKGVASAMLMGVVQSLFRAFSAHENNPARVMQAINEATCRGNESNMFVTLFIGVLDLPTGNLRYCDAGHDAPITLNSALSTLNCIAHLPVGVLENMKFGVQETNITPGSTIFLYTDGLTEARNKNHELFRIQRVENVLGTCLERNLSPKQVLETMSKEVSQFTKGAEQSDDLTMLAIRYTPKQFDSILTETLTLKNDVREVEKLSSFMKTVLDKMNIEKSLAQKLRLAVEEAVVNVIDYAYPADTDGIIEVKMMSDGNKFKAVIIDSGVPFDPTMKEKTDTTLSAEDRQIGGLGILLLRELMDSINYERHESGKNILTLIKQLRTE